MSKVNKMSDNLTETSAGETLAPGKGSGGTMSRSEMLSTFTDLLAQLGKEDLSDLFNRTLAQIGHEADSIPSNAAAKNAATITTKEDMDEIFSGDELTEDLKERASVIFEAALNTRLNVEIAKLEEEYSELVSTLEEEYEEKYQEKLTESLDEVCEKLDLYLDHLVETWMEENKIEMVTSMRTEIAESVLEKMKMVFEDHYITIPEEKTDVIAEMKATIDDLKSKLNETIDQKIQLESVIEEATKEATIDELSEGLAMTQAEKLRQLSEGIEFVDADSYRRKVEIIRENYFSEKKSEPKTTGLITEEIDGTEDLMEEATPVTGVMGKYAAAISRTVK